MNITGITKYWAYFYDDRGDYVGRKKHSNLDKTFKYKDRSFNFIPKKSTQTRFDYFLWERRVTYYNINNPNPILMDKKAEPVLDSQVYNQQLETKLIIDLNQLPNDYLKFLTPQTLIIGLIIIGVLIYVGTGHKIFPAGNG